MNNLKPCRRISPRLQFGRGILAVAAILLVQLEGWAQTGRPDNQWRSVPTQNAAMTYTIQPNSDFVTLGVPFRTNEYGFRDRPVTPKSPDVFRILCVGDSVTFGTGVKNEETFPNLLESFLVQHAPPGKTVDVINAGISAYNVRNIRGAVEEYTAGFQADVVVYTFVENDLDDSVSVGPNGWLMALDTFKQPDEPFVSDDFPAVWLMRRADAGKNGFIDRVFSMFDNQLAMVSQTPPPLLLGDHAEAKARWANFEAELRRMNEVCRASGVPLLVYSFGMANHSEPIVQRVASACGRIGLPHASTLPIFDQATYMKTHSLGYDPHCNTKGHQMMADRLLSFLMETQALKPLVGEGAIPHNTYAERIDPEKSRTLEAKGLAAPRRIDIQREEGVLGMLAGVDVDGKMARWGLFRLAGPGEQIILTASSLLAAPGSPQTIALEVEGEVVQEGIELAPAPTDYTFVIPSQYWNRDIEVRIRASGPVWVPPAEDRLKGATPQTIQLFRIERLQSALTQG